MKEINVFVTTLLERKEQKVEAKDRIIVALDVDSLDRALKLVDQLKDHVGLFKVGLELLTKEGALEVTEAIHKKMLTKTSKSIFYDGKFLDIPNTVAGASKAVCMLKGVGMFNVHASGGIEMMRVAAKIAKVLPPKILAVTVLTSLSEEEAYLSYGAPSKAKVIEFARWAKIAGVDGLICSAQELEVLGKCKEFNDLLKVTPGIRPKWAQKGDQKRVMTPAEAIEAGADYLVIGRPIRKPPKEIGGPIDAAKKIAEEISQAMEEKGGE